MKVIGVEINNFRSISSCELKACGGFNVLIGKNNSGKSNILFAINAFFLALDDGSVVCLNPPITDEVDYHNKNHACPAEIALTLYLREDERAQLIDDMIADSPQMANAVNNLNLATQLKIKFAFNLLPTAFAYVKQISLVAQDGDAEANSEAERIILEVDADAALELRERYGQHESVERQSNAYGQLLSGIDRSDWQRMKTDDRDSRHPYSLYGLIRRMRNVDPDIASMVDPILQDSTSFEEFQNELLQHRDDLTSLGQASDKNRLVDHLVQTFAGRDSTIPNHVLNLLARLSEIKVLSVTDERRSIGRDEAQKLLNLKMRRGGQEHLDRIQETVSTLLGVQIDAFSSVQENPMGQARAELDVDDFVVEVNGSGIKEALRLLLDVEFQEPDILLVEEPEMHLHPALETSVMRYLREVSQTRQVFATTHSTNFLDTPAMKNIYLVSKTVSTSAQMLNQGEVEEQVPTELGIRLSSLFLYDRLVFVESQTDEDILREWAAALDINLNHSNVGFIHMNGSRNISAFAAKSTLSFLAQRQVKMWFLIDRDEKDEEDIMVIRENLGPNAVASVLKKREIENYLVHPGILAKQIAAKLSANRGEDVEEPSLECIEGLIVEAAESLKEMSILKRVANELCRPLYPLRGEAMEEMEDKTIEDIISAQLDQWEAQIAGLKSLIVQEIENQSQGINYLWQDRKLDIVPGDLLIDKVYKHYGVRFRKSKGDGVELARMMTSEEIGSEIKRLIESIVC